MTSTAHILYVDHQGHPAPLSKCFHATASRRLSSSVDRFPPTTVTEVDSAYCPQCLSFHDVASAASLGYCPKPTCKRCPICTAVTVVAVLEGTTCGYQCGHCSWTSVECQVTSTAAPAKDGSIGKPQLIQATEDLGNLLEKKRSETNSPVEDHYRTMLKAWEGVAKDEVRRRNTSGMKVKRGGRSTAEEVWSLETLEASIRNSQEKARAEQLSIVGGQALHQISLDEPLSLDTSLADLPPPHLALQALTSVSSETPTCRAELLPLPVPLRPRKSRRCRAELAEGRPGILVKPKVNPLEGDSSLRSGHGQWWKKDSSAVHVIPRVQVVQHISEDDVHSFLLLITNPTMGPVRLRLAPSEYRGEPTLGGTTPATFLKNVLLDSLSAVHANVSIDATSVATLQETEMVELESEDTLLDLGKSRSAEPASVACWKPSHADSSSKTRLVARQGDHAWFELDIRQEGSKNAKSEDAVYSAVPIALQIQVGGGSWESSLVKPLETDGTDLATFDMLVAWS